MKKTKGVLMSEYMDQITVKMLTGPLYKVTNINGEIEYCVVKPKTRKALLREGWRELRRIGKCS